MSDTFKFLLIFLLLFSVLTTLGVICMFAGGIQWGTTNCGLALFFVFATSLCMGGAGAAAITE